MTKRQERKEFARYAWLSVLGTLGVSCYILADTFFISNGLGIRGLAALNLAIPVYNFIHGSGLMLGMGGATRFSICKSQGDGEWADRIFTNTLYLAGLFSLFFFVMGLLFARPLAFWLGADEAVLEMTVTYLRWLLLFAPAFLLNDVLLCFVRNDDGPQLSMTAMLVGSFANILLDYVFIFLMQMGIFGAIFATGLSPVISILIMCPHWLQKGNSLHLVRDGLEGALAGRVLSLGLPSFVAQLSSGIVMLTFNTIILELEGNTGVAAYGVTANISLVVSAIYTGLAQGMQPLISRFHGKGNSEGSRRLLCDGMLSMAFLSCIIYLFLFLFADPVATVFNSEHSMKLQKIAVQGLRIYFTSNLFVGGNIVLATFFSSVEKTVPAHLLSLLRGLILPIPMTFCLAELWGMTGVWLAYPATELVTAIAGSIVYLFLRRKAFLKKR